MYHNLPTSGSVRSTPSPAQIVCEELRPTNVRPMLESAHRNITELEKAVSQLQDNVSPVLLSPADPGPPTGGDVPTPQMCEISQSLAYLNCRLRNLINWVDILSREVAL